MVAATVVGNAYLLLGTLLFGTLAVLTGWIPLRGRLFYLWARLWSRGLLAANGLRLETTGGSSLDVGPVVFMANHQSLFDIPALLATLPTEARFLAKRELFAIPLFGWSLKVGGFIPVDRERGSSARATFVAAAEAIAEGASILVFPEQTRSVDGHLLPFRRGGFLIALRAEAPIVPVGISGTFEARPKGGLVTRPGTVSVRYGDPVETKGRGVRERREIEARVRSEIASLAGRAGEASGKLDGPRNDGKETETT